ncbi:MAG TPA: LLM class flavin-dependent oxidoreductase [Ktedonobacteraceae bacterium]|nr:LLM class flavin-dependent oxidoreductase [Ktedonobacteraceae bacterium]
MHNPTHFGLCIPAFLEPGMTSEDYATSFQQGIAVLSDHIDSLWMIDHLQSDDLPLLEAWTTLTYWAALQPRLNIGHVVLAQSFRNPALLAKMAATLQYLTGGRFILGIGTGWKEEEYRAYGYNFPSPGTRIAEFEETLQIIKALWTEKQATFHGKHYQVTEAYCEPKPDPLPPIMIGGSKPRMLRLIARYADWWNVSWRSIEDYRQLVAECERACDEVGRDPATLRRTWFGGCLCVENEAELQQLNANNVAPQRGIVGTPQQVIEQIQAFIELGVDHFELAWGPDSQIARRSFELLVKEVFPALKY